MRSTKNAIARPSCIGLTLLIGATLSGCANLPLDPGYAGPASLPPHVRAIFTPEGAPPQGVMEEISINDQFSVKRARLASDAERLAGLVETQSHEVVVDLYTPLTAAPAPVVLVLPTLGGDNEIARHFAKVFARRGLAACIVHRQEEYKDFDDLKLLNPTFEQIVLDHKLAIDWLMTRSDIDATRLGLFGVSAGAIKGAIIVGVEERIKASVLALAGGDIPHIFAYSTEKGIREEREKILQREQITAEDLEQAIRDEFKHDPLVYAPYVDARTTLLVLGRFDPVVPYDTGMRLRTAMGGPRTIVLASGHYTAILYVPYLERAAVKWFREKLRNAP